MTVSPKTRILMLLVVTLFTLLALAPPQPAQACPAGEVDQCYYPNGVQCTFHDCTGATSCNGLPSGTPTCYYVRTECCW
jgi:hypothetical protein